MSLQIRRAITKGGQSDHAPAPASPSPAAHGMPQRPMGHTWGPPGPQQKSLILPVTDDIYDLMLSRSIHSPVLAPWSGLIPSILCSFSTHLVPLVRSLHLFHTLYIHKIMAWMCRCKLGGHTYVSLILNTYCLESCVQKVTHMVPHTISLSPHQASPRVSSTPPGA